MAGSMNKFIQKGFRSIKSKLASPEVLKKLDELKKPNETSSVNKGVQILLKLKYQELLHNRHLPLPTFEEVEFRAFSQCGEDGILLYIFSIIGTVNKRVVDIGCGNCIVSNHANLVINHGWFGLLIDGSEVNIRKGKDFYDKSPDTLIWPPILVNAWITKDNINTIINSHSFQGEIDLLSIDIDGMDFWIWRAIDCISPRVVVVEYMDMWGPDESMSVPYQEDFTGKYDESGLYYGGASLAAFVKIAKEKGYRLVGCQRYGFNAFFIRAGVGEDVFPEISPADCFNHPKAKYSMERRLERAKEYEWVKV
jgi:hypothetical protein